MTHWHHDPVTHQPTLVGGPVDPGGCCKPYASWADVFGPDANTPKENTDV